MLYATVRRVLGFALRMLYRLEVAGGAFPAQGPLLLVGNHPNALIDPALLLAVCPRPLTFLAKAPLFRLPLLGGLLRVLGALPVQRRQDGVHDAQANTAVLEASASALAAAHALAIFPEGKSHSDPQLAELRTGAARMALAAGVPVQVLPVGLTYEEKGRFRSTVRLEVGAVLHVSPLAEPTSAAVRALTVRIGDALRAVTLQLGAWEDLPLIATAEALYALRTKGPAEDAERRRLFARGMTLLREEQPERYAALRAEVAALARRLALLKAEPDAVAVHYRVSTVARFLVRNVLALLLGLPLAAVGLLLFLPWSLAVRGAVAAAHVEDDMVATVKLLAALLLGPVYVLGLAAVAWHFIGLSWALGLTVAALPLALFTRSFLARRKEALRDVRLFFQLGNRSRAKRHLLAEGDALALRIQAVADELAPRVAPPAAAPPPESAR
jgi:glycerol-3-phosphate O-acyltransferase / dihydroxyacetone phosphate acyltransferase